MLSTPSSKRLHFINTDLEMVDKSVEERKMPADYLKVKISEERNEFETKNNY